MIEQVYASKVKYPTPEDFKHQLSAGQLGNESACEEAQVPDLKDADRLAGVLWNTD